MGGRAEKPRQTSNISSSVSTRMAPHCFSAASQTTSTPAIEPVCESAARWPALLRPAFTTTTGLIFASSAIVCMN